MIQILDIKLLRHWLLGVPLLFVFGAGCAAPPVVSSVKDEAALQPFIQEMVARHHFDSAKLNELFAKGKMQPSIINAISRPAEGKPWHEYRPIFLTPSRIDLGIEYWNRHEKILEKAKKAYGVDPKIIVAIIGVETRYGRNSGSYKVLDALSTLAFGYPPRAKFFRSELEHFLLLSREEQVDPLLAVGSYAGAMGQGQFIPSSYRRYAVDFNKDGQRDLWHSPEDIIGSVANYLHQHAWEPDQAIASQAQVHGERYRTLLGQGLKPHTSLSKMRQYGIEPATPLPLQRLATLIDLEVKSGHEYWVGMNNFYVITRYNHSALYAMAVFQLATEIAEGREAVNKL